MSLSLDVAVDIYPINVAQNLTLQLASTLGKGTGDAEGGGDGDRNAWRMTGGAGLADEFDYVMYGKVRLH
jgi:DNA-directed RNA polymerase I, II, and III subunit RPABC3